MTRIIKAPPQSLEAERAAIGSVLIDPRQLLNVAGAVEEEDFYHQKHRTIWGAMRRMSEQGAPIDLLSLSEALKDNGLLDSIGGASYLSELMAEVPTASNARHYAEMVRDKSIARSLIRAGEKISEVGFEEKGGATEVLSDAFRVVQDEIFTLSTSKTAREASIRPLVKSFEEIREMYRKQPEGTLIGHSTGFKEIDSSIDGVRKGHMWVIAGYTNQGKSSFAINVLSSLLKQDLRVLFYSLEMSEWDIIAKLLGVLSGQSSRAILKGKGDGSESKWMEFLSERDLSIYTDKRRLEDILISIRENHAKRPVDAVFIDYLQQVTVLDAKSEYESMKAVASSIQSIGLELQVPVIGVSQISNEAARNPNSAVMGFKGAGEIASAADIALELVSGEDNVESHREKTMQGLPTKTRVIIKKNRHGPTGVAEYHFNGKTGRFTDTDELVEQEFFFGQAHKGLKE